MNNAITAIGNAVAICAHPDDESFGLGAILSTLTRSTRRVGVVCFTHGEASTLSTSIGDDLGTTRTRELEAAANTLGIDETLLLDYPDGHLESQPLDELAEHVRRFAQRLNADTLVTFDEGGITGHPDHQTATGAALAAATSLNLTVLAWTLPEAVAALLNEKYQATFAGQPVAMIDVELTVDRTRQRAAISCHQSQSTNNAVLWSRLQLLGNREHLRYLRRRHTPPA